VNATSPDQEKDEAQCDRDEGDVSARFTAAAQAYLEWLPLRRQEGNMGVVTIGTITQVISWGNLATFVGFDTRISHRSEEPTLNSNTWEGFFPLAATYPDVAEYRNESSPAYTMMIDQAEATRLVQENETFTLIGESIEILRENFASSKEKGQPWQVWVTATALGRAIKGDYYEMSSLINDTEVAEQVRAFTDALYSDPAQVFPRSLRALALTMTPWNRDDFSGFAYEQRRILEMFAEVTNNPIVLAGDLHDAYGWQLYENGSVDGTPAAVNLVVQSVTSPVRACAGVPKEATMQTDPFCVSMRLHHDGRAGDRSLFPFFKTSRMQFQDSETLKMSTIFWNSPKKR
jgi:alkaline phosphatase D